LQYDKTNDSIVKNWKTKAHSKIVWKIKENPEKLVLRLEAIWKSSRKSGRPPGKKSGSLRINCIVSI
jgi:hypothetical protein